MGTPLDSRIRRAAAALVAATLPIIGIAAPAAASATAGPSGTATALNALASLVYGGTGMQVGVDRAVSVWGASPSAEAAIDVLTAGATTLGGGSRAATTEAESGTDALAIGEKNIEGLASASITDASLGAVIEPGRAISTAVVTLTDLSLLGGLVTAASAQTSTTSTVSTTSARVQRTLELGDVKVLSIRRLLQELGIDPTALTCAGVEAAGAELGVDASTACESLAGAQAAIGDVQTALSDRGAMLLSDLQTAEATIAGLTIVTQPLIDLAAAYGVDLSGLLGLLLPSGQRDGLIDEIQSQLDAVDDGVAVAAGGTCAAAGQAVVDVVAAVPSLDGTLTPLAAAVEDACAVLQSLLDGVLDVSLLTLDAVSVGLNATAEPDAPLAEGTGTIGAVSVGNRAITLAGISSLGSSLQTAIGSAKAETADALTALGIGTFPEPEIEILGVDASAGRDQAGTWFAGVTVTGLHVAIPPVPISLATGPSMSDVLGATSAGSRAADRAFAPVAVSPEIVVDAAVFSGDARFNAAGDVDPAPDPDPALDPDPDLGTGGTPLPSTGVGLPRLAALLLLLAAAACAKAVTRTR